ncbi:MAG: hypothetical protein ACE368_03780 [Paracoccaceae bacterium]
MLILGGGDRERSIGLGRAANPQCDKLIVAPGNAGIAGIAECASLDISPGGRRVVTFTIKRSDFIIVDPRRRWTRASRTAARSGNPGL